MEVTERKSRDKGLKSAKSASFNQLEQDQTHIILQEFNAVASMIMK